MIVRKAEPQDREQLVLLVHKFDDYYLNGSIFPRNYLPFADYKNKDEVFKEVVNHWLSDHSYFLFVADSGGELIGYICGTIHSRTERKLNREGFIEDWFVIEEKRGQGIGRKLYEALVNVFKMENCTHLGLKAYAANKSARELYGRMGYMESEISMVKLIE